MHLTRYYLLRLWRLSWFGPAAAALYAFCFLWLPTQAVQPGVVCVILMLLASCGAAVAMSLFGRDETDLALPYSRSSIAVCRLGAGAVSVLVWLLCGLAMVMLVCGSKFAPFATAQSFALAFYGIGLFAILSYLRVLSLSVEVEERLYARLGLLVTGIVAVVILYWISFGHSTAQMVLRAYIAGGLWGAVGVRAGLAAHGRYREWEVIPAEKRREAVLGSQLSARPASMAAAVEATACAGRRVLGPGPPAGRRASGAQVTHRRSVSLTLAACVFVAREVCAGAILWVHLSYVVMSAVIVTCVPPVGSLLGMVLMFLTYGVLGTINVVRLFLAQTVAWSGLPLPRRRLFACFCAPAVLCVCALVAIGMRPRDPTVPAGTFSQVDAAELQTIRLHRGALTVGRDDVWLRDDTGYRRRVTFDHPTHRVHDYNPYELSASDPATFAVYQARRFFGDLYLLTIPKAELKRAYESAPDQWLTLTARKYAAQMRELDRRRRLCGRLLIFLLSLTCLHVAIPLRRSAASLWVVSVGVLVPYVIIALGVFWCCCDVRGLALLVRITGVVWQRPAFWLGACGIAAAVLYLSAQERFVKMEFAPSPALGDAGRAQMA